MKHYNENEPKLYRPASYNIISFRIQNYLIIFYSYELNKVLIIAPE